MLTYQEPNIINIIPNPNPNPIIRWNIGAIYNFCFLFLITLILPLLLKQKISDYCEIFATTIVEHTNNTTLFIVFLIFGGVATLLFFALMQLLYVSLKNCIFFVFI